LNILENNNIKETKEIIKAGYGIVYRKQNYTDNGLSYNEMIKQNDLNEGCSSQHLTL
jgi:hypothetical protein